MNTFRMMRFARFLCSTINSNLSHCTKKQASSDACFIFLPLFPEVVEAQGCGETATLFVPDGGDDQHHCRDGKGQCLIQLGGNCSQPAQRAGEGCCQRSAGHPEGVEETEHECAEDCQRRIPVGEDDQRHRDPAVAVDPADGAEGDIFWVQPLKLQMGGLCHRFLEAAVLWIGC